ncbi:MAG: hypothetical protein RDV48_11485 [Candidatus Eremiobacteraeota bacterium]|nr:hypothetical protein [Candidatus Eremiobacteraeota bacterium]
MKLYIETSAILYLLADSEPYKKDRTVEMYEKLSTVAAELMISAIYEAEIKKAPPMLAKCLPSIMDKKKIVKTDLRDSHITMAALLAEQEIVPSLSVFEAIHLACALCEKCDIFVTWDFEAIYESETLVRLKKFTAAQSLAPLIVASPEMLLRQGYGGPKSLHELREMRNLAIEESKEKSSKEIILSLGSTFGRN